MLGPIVAINVPYKLSNTSKDRQKAKSFLLRLTISGPVHIIATVPRMGRPVASRRLL